MDRSSVACKAGIQGIISKLTLVGAKRPLALDLQANFGNLKGVGDSFGDTRRRERA